MNKKRMIYIGVSIFLTLSITILLAFNSFKKDLSPSDTITAFHELASTGKIEESKQYISNDIIENFEKGQFWFYGSYANFIRDYNEDTKTVTPITKSLEIVGETATIDVKIKDHQDYETEDTYYLIKEDGRWKIAE